MALLLCNAAFFLLAWLTISARADQTGLSRCDFPEDFIFGASASAFQYEGAVDEGGRKPSIWDIFAANPRNIADGSSPNITDDQYHHYTDDVLLLKNLGMDSYRFSISWTRVFHDGRVNPEGIAYYNNLIDALLEHGIKPFVTIYHWDLPQTLQDKFGGWLSRDIVDEYLRFADFCFQAFGDRVKNWLTFNEPHQLVNGGYVQGYYAPGRCTGCPQGNSSTEPYIVGHHLLLAHAKAVKLYRRKYKVNQRGVIGMTLDSFWYEPYSSLPRDIAAARRALDFELGWFLHPITFGDYPQSMRLYVGDRLPAFTVEESRDLRNSMDFVGLNHYTSRYTQDNPWPSNVRPGYESDSHTHFLTQRNGNPIGGTTGTWLYVVPWGLYNVLNHVKENYNNPPIIITENGLVDIADSNTFSDKFIKDGARVQFYESYLTSLQQAIADGVDVRGYYAWSFLDNWEWNNGYSQRFGLYYVDYTTLKRYPKHSALWFKQFLSNTKCSGKFLSVFFTDLSWISNSTRDYVKPKSFFIFCLWRDELIHGLEMETL
ncbi:beta-glucosidase 26 isoform X2 [Selaginella moellendorffii]|uniref:beta-glucosidase 26 isoform X2 n=1 Tax=Selaginella moellendorffii TaxID=88036 RepID=UPI000D1CD641|nr:beta-glucosidase 26 isoform X2 [Selaginella moellendorffii]|eukprot:XP_024523667.1 beta-glucosidase 26 isoform X2 [Selaginella moellendorffii]